jgi:hypothetical protein
MIFLTARGLSALIQLRDQKSVLPGYIRHPERTESSRTSG